MRRSWVFGAVLGIVCTQACLAQVIYSVTDLDTLPGLPNSSATGINNFGDVIGFSSGSTPGSGNALLWSAATGLKDLGSFSPVAINDNKTVLGSEGELWSPTNGLQTGLIDTSTLLGHFVSTTGINNAGQVVGSTLNTGFIWTQATGAQPIYTPNGQTSQAAGINNAGQVAGTLSNFAGRLSYVWNGQTQTIIPPIPNSILGQTASSINDFGHVAGYSFVSTNYPHAFAWTGGSTTADLGVLPGGTQSFANSINATDTVVGRSDVGAGWAAFVAPHAGGMQNLNNLLNSTGTGWQLTSANGINNAGQIVGQGDHNGAIHAFVLTPFMPLSPAAVAPVTEAPRIDLFPPPNNLFRDTSSFVHTNASDFSTATVRSVSASTQLLGALVDASSNQFLKDFASSAGEQLSAWGKVGTVALASTEPNLAAREASLALMLAPDSLSTVSVKALLQTPTLVKFANYEWATSGGEPFHAAVALVNFSYGTLLAHELKVFGTDPVDFNYQSLALPSPIPDVLNHLPSTMNPTVDAAFASTLRSITTSSSYLQAANASFDKYTGAIAAGDAYSATMQMDAFMQYLVSYNIAAGNAQMNMAQLGALLASADFKNPTYDPQSLIAVQEMISSNGFDPTTQSLLISMGLSSADLETLQEHILAIAPASLSGDQLGALDNASVTLAEVTTTPEPSLMGPVFALSILIFYRYPQLKAGCHANLKG